EPGCDEVVELHLADRTLPGQRRADTDAEDRPFREGGVDDPVAELGEQGPEQQEGVSISAADVFAEDERARVAPEDVAEPEHHAFEEGASRAIERRSWI